MGRYIIPVTVEADTQADRESFEDWLYDLIDTAVSARIPGYVPLGYIEDDDGEDVPVTIRLGGSEITPR